MNDHVVKTIQVYDQIARDYAVQADLHVPVIERDKFIKLVIPGGRILDAGCGSGRDCKFFSEKGFITIGIDLSEKLLKIAKTNSPRTKFIKTDLRSISFKNSYFDGIWANASLLHLTKNEMQKAVHNLYEILRPGGLLFIKLKAGKGEKFIIQPSVPNLTRFFCFYSKSEVKQLLEQNNFKITELITFDEGSMYDDRRGIWWISCFARKPLYKT